MGHLATVTITHVHQSQLPSTCAFTATLQALAWMRLVKLLLQLPTTATTPLATRMATTAAAGTMRAEHRHALINMLLVVPLDPAARRSLLVVVSLS